MASSSSLTPGTYEDDDWNYEASTSVVLLFDDDAHPTIWDPTEGQVYIMSGRIVCEMTLPDERFLAVSLSLDQCFPPDGTGTAGICSLIEATLVGPGGGISLSAPNVVHEPNWTLELRYYRLDIVSSYSLTNPCHFINFKAFIPVGSHIFTDIMGSGSVTRSFRFLVESVTKYPTSENPSGIPKVEMTQEFFTVTTLDTRRIMSHSLR